MTYVLPRVTEVPTVALEGKIDVTVLGAQAAGMFCTVLRRLARNGATLAIVGAPGPIARVLELCAIDGVELHASAGAALAPRPDRAARPDFA